MSVPLPTFFSKPERSQLRISPRRTWFAWVARDAAGILNIWIQKYTDVNCDSAELIKGKQITFADDRDICLLFFFSLDDRYLLYLRETRHASEMYHLYALTLDAEYPWDSHRDLIHDPKCTVAVGFVGGIQIWQPPDTPDQILIAVGRGSLFWDVCRLNIDTEKLEVVAKNPMSSTKGILGVVANVALYLLRRTVFGICCSPGDAPGVPAIQWFPDRHRGFEIRGRVEVTLFPELSMSFAAKALNSNEWQTIQTIPFPKANMQIIGASGGSGTLRMDFTPCGSKVDIHTSIPRDTSAFVRLPICPAKDGREHGEEHLIANDARCDISGFVCHPETGKVEAVAYEFHKEDLVAVCEPDENNRPMPIVSDLKLLRELLNERQFRICSRTLDGTTWVVFATGDVHPGDFYMFRKDCGNLTHLFAVRPQLHGVPLASMRSANIPTRDGESLVCFVSAPTRLDSEHLGRGVIYVHGGPMARDSWGYDPGVQLLCSRGMLVLQVNYRGSVGFGRRFSQLPNGDVDSIRRDIADASRWLITQGLVADQKLGIVGASWGGYEALCGMTFDADLYRCGVAIVPLSTVGASNTSKAFRGDPLAKRYWDRVYGKAAHDQRSSDLISPLYHVSKICRPLMLVHGSLDVRVPIEHSNTIVQAMQKQCIKGYYVCYSDEGHGVRKERNIIDMWGRIERFLCHTLELPMPPHIDAKWTIGHSATVQWDGLGIHEEASRL